MYVHVTGISFLSSFFPSFLPCVYGSMPADVNHTPSPVRLPKCFPPSISSSSSLMSISFPSRPLCCAPINRTRRRARQQINAEVNVTLHCTDLHLVLIHSCWSCHLEFVLSHLLMTVVMIQSNSRFSSVRGRAGLYSLM